MRLPAIHHAIDASNSTSQSRTDVLTAQKAAGLAIAKTPDKTTPREVDSVIYDHSHQPGPNNTTRIVVTELLPGTRNGSSKGFRVSIIRLPAWRRETEIMKQAHRKN